MLAHGQIPLSDELRPKNSQAELSHGIMGGANHMLGPLHCLVNELAASAPEPVPFSGVAPFILNYRRLLVEVALIAIPLRLLTLVEPFAFQAVIDRVLPFQRQQTLVTIVIVLLAVALFQAALGATSFYLSQHTGNRITSDLGRELYGHMLRLRLPFVQSWPVG